MGDEASVRAGQADAAAGPVAAAPGPDVLRREILIPGGQGAAFAARAGRVGIPGAASEILGRPDIRQVFLGQSGTDSPAAQSPTGQAARDLNSPTHPTSGREP
jgi:hypothetical protein